MSKKLKFKTRSQTKYAYLISQDLNCLPYGSYRAICRRKGDLDTGYHFYIDRCGSVSADREIDEIASYEFDNNEQAIFILIDTRPTGLTDVQHYELEHLCDELQALYPNIQLIRQ